MCLMKSICVSQHCVLKVLLLMWSSPAALLKVKLSASRRSTGPQSLLSQAAYHFRVTSSFVKFCSPNEPALSCLGRLTAPTSAQVPVASRFLRDTAMLVLVSFSCSLCFEHLPTALLTLTASRITSSVDAISFAFGCALEATSATPRYF